MHDGSGDELGKEGDEQAVVEKAGLSRLAPEGVHLVGDLLKGEEGDGQGQGDGPDLQVETRQLGGGVHEEVGVLEVAEEAEVQGDSRQHVESRPVSPRAPQAGAPQQIVGHHGDGDESQIPGVPPAVEEQGCDHEPADGRSTGAASPQREESEQDERQEQEQEYVGVEQHGFVSASSSSARPVG